MDIGRQLFWISDRAASNGLDGGSEWPTEDRERGSNTACVRAGLRLKIEVA